MKKILICVSILACMLLNGCMPAVIIALSVGQAEQSGKILQSQQITVKNQRGIFFERYLVYPQETASAPIMHVKIKTVVPQSDAEKAGIKAGDEIIMVNDTEVCQYYDMGIILRPFFSGEDKPIKLTMRRNNYEYVATLNPL